MNEWISFFTTWILFPLSVIAVYEGIKSLTLKKHTVATIIIVCIGAGFLFGRAGFVYWGYGKLKITIENFNSEFEIPILSREKFRDFSNEEFSERTKSLASLVFDETGKIIDYVNKNEISVKYSPTEQEIKKREIRLSQIAELRAQVSFLLTQVYILIISALSAVIAGYIVAKNEALKTE